MIRGQAPDFNLEIPMSEIQPQDIEMLTRELNLRETTPTTLEALVNSFGRDKWFSAFKEMRSGAVIETEDGKKIPAPDSVAFWAESHNVNRMAAEGLYSKLNRVFNKPYIVEKPASDGIREIVKALQAGQHVVLSFGKFESDLDYLLVSNILTRMIRQVWEESTNAFRSSGEKEPRPLVIVVEEAHKAAQPRNGRPDHFQHHRPRAAQVLRHAADHRPAPLANLRRGHVAAGYAHQRLAGR